MNIDIAGFHALNALTGRWYALDLVFGYAQSVNLLKGAPFVAAFIWFWYRSAPPERQWRRRAVTLNLLPSVFLALVLNRAIAVLTPFRQRPMFDPALAANPPHPDLAVQFDLEHWTSFPSDTATFFFAMVAGLWLISRRAGLGFGLYALLYICGSRIYFGIHYPSDIVVGMALGVTVTLAVNWLLRDRLVGPVARFAEARPEWFHAIFFLAAFELGSIFENVRRLQHGLLVSAVRGLGAFLRESPTTTRLALAAVVLAAVVLAGAWLLLRRRAAPAAMKPGR
jgi:membrane-associated phospholipid phosphatase